jgi:hypothetical protein
MAHEHSYGATIKNNKTENSAVDFLLLSDSRFRRPTKAERKELLIRLSLPTTFARAFDLVLLPNVDYTDILKVPLKEIILIELKTTQKKLPENPNGFFFGATENEFNLADRLGEQYRFCFISLHSESKSFALLTLKELTLKIKTKRLQYQINL